MTIYTDVNYNAEKKHFTAKLISDVKRGVLIEKALSNIYIRSPYGDVYTAVKYDDTAQLRTIHDYLVHGTLDSKVRIDSIVIRFGYLDRRLNSLHWLDLTELFKRWSYGTATRTEKNKFRQVLKVLNLSTRSVKLLMAPEIKYS